MSVQGSALVLAWVAILVLTLAMTGLIRQVRFLSDRLEEGGPAASPGNGAPTSRTRHGLRAGVRASGLEDLLGTDGGRLGIVFASDACRSCEERLDELGDVVDGDHDRVVVVRRRPPDDALAGRSRHGFREVQRGDLFEAFQVTVTPAAFAVDGHGTVVGSVLLGSTAAVEEFTTMMKEA